MLRFIIFLFGFSLVVVGINNVRADPESLKETKKLRPSKVTFTNLPDWQQALAKIILINARFVSGTKVKILDSLLGPEELPEDFKGRERLLENDIYLVVRLQARELLRQRILSMTLKLVKPPKGVSQKPIDFKGSLKWKNDSYYLVYQVINADLIRGGKNETTRRNKILATKPEFEIVSMTAK
jgi:hypothetical protein